MKQGRPCIVLNIDLFQNIMNKVINRSTKQYKPQYKTEVIKQHNTIHDTTPQDIKAKAINDFIKGLTGDLRNKLWA